MAVQADGPFTVRLHMAVPAGTRTRHGLTDAATLRLANLRTKPQPVP